MRKRRRGAIWDYLESTGVLEKGSDEEIKAARRLYRKQYFLQYKQKQRTHKPEYTICFSKNEGENERIQTAAKNHNLTVPAFIKAAVFGYLNRSYIVPNRMQVATLYQVLLDCLNEIKTLVSKKEHFFWDREQKLDSIEKRIQKLEVQINEIFSNPPVLPTHHDYQNQTS